jgi:hypothetical protein
VAFCTDHGAPPITGLHSPHRGLLSSRVSWSKSAVPRSWATRGGLATGRQAIGCAIAYRAVPMPRARGPSLPVSFDRPVSVVPRFSLPGGPRATPVAPCAAAPACRTADPARLALRVCGIGRWARVPLDAGTVPLSPRPFPRRNFSARSFPS